MKHFFIAHYSLDSLSSEIAQSIVEEGYGQIIFDNLNSLSSKAAKSLAETSASIEFSRLEILTVEAAEALIPHLGVLKLPSLREMQPGVGAMLAQHCGPLELLNLEKLSGEDAAGLAIYAGKLFLPKIKYLNLESARNLVAHQGGLDLSGLVEISSDIASTLSEYDDELKLSGIKSISDIVARHLGNHKGTLHVNGLKTLSDASAELLARHQGAIHLDGLDSLSPSAVEALIEHNDFISLNGIAHMDENVDKLLKNHPEPISLKGIKKLSFDHVAMMISRQEDTVILDPDVSGFLKLYEEAQYGNYERKSYVASCFENGIVVCKDLEMAAYWYSMAEEIGNTKTLSCPAHSNWRAAHHGDPDAQFVIANCFADGNGLPLDTVKAAHWYQRSAEGGHAKAQCILADLFDKGKGFSLDASQAFEWYAKAAENGDACAQFEIARRLIDGIVVPEDKLNGVSWLRKAAEQDHQYAQFHLGYFCEHGIGMSRDIEEAINWYQRSSDQGNPAAHYGLAVLLARNNNGIYNKEILSLLCKAGESGLAAARNSINEYYSINIHKEHMFNFRNFLKNSTEAIKWRTIAADKGDQESQYVLGFYYLIGCGVIIDEKVGYEWLRKSKKTSIECEWIKGVELDLFNSKVIKSLRNSYSYQKKLYEKAESGSVSAAYDIANWWFRLGLLELGAENMLVAAKSGGSKAQYLMGTYYEKGVGVRIDHSEAMFWHEKAMQQGFTRGKFRLFNLLLEINNSGVDFATRAALK